MKSERPIFYHRYNASPLNILFCKIGRIPDVIGLCLILCYGAYTQAQGTAGITYEAYYNISGSRVSDLQNATKYPDQPDYTSVLTSFEAPRNLLGDYGARVSGYLTAPETGTYYFWISGDDHTILELSSDNNAANKTQIAEVPLWSNYLEWNKYTEQKSQGINLIAGTSYYIEANLKAVGSNDHLEVGWRKPSDGNGTSPIGIIPNSVLTTEDTAGSAIGVQGIALNQSTIDVHIGETFTVSAIISPSNATNKNVTWSTSDPTVFTISTSGLITAVEAGTATVTGRTEEGGHTATATVTVSASTPVTSTVWDSGSSNTIYYNGGNVGIGVTNTGTYKLAIEGHVRAREVRVDQNTWPDYVFKEGYDLPTLDEIQEHIQKYGHLPNVPSAEEVRTNGVQLGEMNRLLLQKIEELTLYILEQEKKQKLLENRIEELMKY